MSKVAKNKAVSLLEAERIARSFILIAMNVGQLDGAFSYVKTMLRLFDYSQPARKCANKLSNLVLIRRCQLLGFASNN